MAADTLRINNPLAALTQLPGMRQLLVILGLAASISVGVTAAFWMREPGYAVLYANVSDKEAGEVVNTLTSAAIPHELDRNTGAIKVPAARLHEARLKLAEQGLPRGAGFGLEIISGDSGFSTSQFMEGARYHHALETELARTIANLQPVQSARVHLAVPKSTVFLGRKQTPGASVLLQLYPGRSLAESQVAAIVHLVASSIPDLEAGRVTVVDQQGRLLNSPEDSAAMGLNARQLDYVRRLETDYVARIESLLLPMLGPGRARATVTADIDFTQREETQELYDPETVVRSEQVAEERSSGAFNGGIPGALSNQPPDTPAAAVPADAVAAQAAASSAGGAGRPPGNESIRRTRNFEMDRTTSHVRQAQGTIRRLSVAVLIDEKQIVDDAGEVSTQKLSGDELAELTRLIRDAVGFDEQRGDSLSIGNVAFYQNPAEDELPEAGFFDNPAYQTLAKQALAGLLLIGVALLLVRPLLGALAGGSGGSVLAGAGGSAGGATASLATDTPRAPLSFDDKISVARQLADRNPERVAQIVRTWMQTDG